MVIKNKFFELRINTRCSCGAWEEYGEDCGGWDYFVLESKPITINWFNDNGYKFFKIYIGKKHIYSSNVGWFRN